MKETKMKRVPKLRFPEFTDDWEQRKVGEVTKELLDYDNFSSGLPLLTSSRSGLMYQSEYRGNATTENENTLFSVVPLNACTYRHMSDDSTFHLNINTLEKGLVSKEYPVFQENESNLKFIVQYINSSNSFTKFCTEQKKGGTRTRLYYKTLCEYKLMMPSIKEQNKTANFFDTLDHLITLHQRKLEKLKELRKGVMKKLFSQEVRFKADDGSEFPDWEEKKLGDDVQFINGRAYKQDELLNSGKYLVLRVGNLFTNDSYYYSDLELDNDKYIENGDLIYAWSATFGPRIYYGEKCIYHYHIWKLKFDENIISKIFLNYYLLYDVEKIKSQRTGGTMVHITKNAMEHRELQFPCLAEQQKIADCLSTLDDVIEKQKATLAAWEELKKGLLQQMFV